MSVANSQDGIHVYAAVLDVLGYRNRLDEDRQSGTPNFKALLQNAMSSLSEINEAECSVQAISDTIFLTWTVQATLVQFLRTLKSLFIAFLEQGLFLRGGVTYSKHFKSGQVTYSYAFAAAYDLESQSAIYPRIVIDENIVLMFQNPESGLDFRGLIEARLLLQLNGTYFLNVIDEDNWQMLRDHAASTFEHDMPALTKKESAFAKHVWFENYLFQSRFKKGERYTPPPRLIQPEEAEPVP